MSFFYLPVGAKFGNKNLIMKWYKPAALSQPDTAQTDQSSSQAAQQTGGGPETLTVTISTKSASGGPAAAPAAAAPGASGVTRADSVLDEQDDLLAGEGNEEVCLLTI